MSSFVLRVAVGAAPAVLEGQVAPVLEDEDDGAVAAVGLVVGDEEGVVALRALRRAADLDSRRVAVHEALVDLVARAPGHEAIPRDGVHHEEADEDHDGEEEPDLDRRDEAPAVRRVVQEHDVQPRLERAREVDPEDRELRHGEVEHAGQLVVLVALAALARHDAVVQREMREDQEAHEDDAAEHGLHQDLLGRVARRREVGLDALLPRVVEAPPVVVRVVVAPTEPRQGRAVVGGLGVAAVAVVGVVAGRKPREVEARGHESVGVRVEEADLAVALCLARTDVVRRVVAHAHDVDAQVARAGDAGGAAFLGRVVDRARLLVEIVLVRVVAVALAVVGVVVILEAPAAAIGRGRRRRVEVGVLVVLRGGGGRDRRFGRVRVVGLREKHHGDERLVDGERVILDLVQAQGRAVALEARGHGAAGDRGHEDG